MMLDKLVLVVSAFANLVVAQHIHVVPDEDFIVTLNSPEGSRVKGLKLNTDKSIYYGFIDIPYAESTAGENRFREPVPKKPWSEILYNEVSSHTCPQPDDPGTEDCLVLNVFTPNLPKSDEPSNLLPTLVWIHGGAFLEGKGASYRPKFFIDEKILVVTINYRLGVLGFLNTGDGVIPANIGLKDQRLAIEWVYQNIEKFGGDPNNIKIAGESAGAASVGWHLLGNRKVHFNGAIMASGTSLCGWANQKKSKQNAFAFARTLRSDFNSSNSSDLLKLLRSATSDAIIKAGDQNAVGIRFLPTADKDFSEAPTDDVDSGRIVKVPTLFGFNSEEMVCFLTKEEVAAQLPLADHFGEFLKSYFKLNFTGNNADVVGSALKNLYTNSTFASNAKEFIRMQTDLAFIAPISRHAESLSKYNNETYMYRLTYKYSNSPPSTIPNMTGVGHGMDVPLLWPMLPLNDADRAMSKTFVKLWADFIRSGHPYVPYIDWHPISPNNLTYLNLDLKPSTDTDPRNYKAIKAVLDKYLARPIINF